MTQKEIETLEKKELSLHEEVTAGWKSFWNKRGVTAKLVTPRARLPDWYRRAFCATESMGVNCGDLEPEELMQRALTRKMNLKWM